jgi:hypothetical protein
MSGRDALFSAVDFFFQSIKLGRQGTQDFLFADNFRSHTGIHPDGFTPSGTEGDVI